MELDEETGEGGGGDDGGDAETPDKGGEGSEAEGERDSVGIVTAQFTSACNGKPLTKSKEALMVSGAAYCCIYSMSHKTINTSTCTCTLLLYPTLHLHSIEM